MTALASTLRYCPVLATESDGRLAAIVDLTFNLGAGRLQTSTLCRWINQRDWSGVALELRRWVNSGRKVLPGLAARLPERTLGTQDTYLRRVGLSTLVGCLNLVCRRNVRFARSIYKGGRQHADS